jgi:uroporphyrinogen-III synthase
VADLGGRVVAFLEGRRSGDLADLIRRHNGVPLPAPCLREVHQPEAPALQAALARALAAPNLLLTIFLTGVGTQTVFAAAQHAGREADLRSALEHALVAVRGPKPAAALRSLGVRIDLAAPPPHTTEALLDALASIDVHDASVLVQLYGEPNPTLCQALAARGADIVELAPYVWDRPADSAPILQLLDALDQRRVDALLVTSQAQVDNLYAVAAEHGRSPRLDGLVIGAQGPVAAAALARHGAQATIIPPHGHMGALVLALATVLTHEGVRS